MPQFESHVDDRALLLRVAKVLRADAKACLEQAQAPTLTTGERRALQERAGRLQGDLQGIDQLRRRIEAAQVPGPTHPSERGWSRRPHHGRRG